MIKSNLYSHTKHVLNTKAEQIFDLITLMENKKKHPPGSLISISIVLISPTPLSISTLYIPKSLAEILLNISCISTSSTFSSDCITSIQSESRYESV